MESANRSLFRGIKGCNYLH